MAVLKDWKVKEYVAAYIWAKVDRRYPKAEIAAQCDDLWLARANFYSQILHHYHRAGLL